MITVALAPPDSVSTAFPTLWVFAAAASGVLAPVALAEERRGPTG